MQTDSSYNALRKQRSHLLATQLTTKPGLGPSARDTIPCLPWPSDDLRLDCYKAQEPSEILLWSVHQTSSSGLSWRWMIDFSIHPKKPINILEQGVRSWMRTTRVLQIWIPETCLTLLPRSFGAPSGAKLWAQQPQVEATGAGKHHRGLVTMVWTQTISWWLLWAKANCNGVFLTSSLFPFEGLPEVYSIMHSSFWSRWKSV